jgi:ammonium transporter, Amt family
MKKWIRRIVLPTAAPLIMGFFTRSAHAQNTTQAEDGTMFSAVDTIWVLISGFLVFFMQCGFGFLEAGFVRSKNVVNIMAENSMDTTATTVGFIIAGFGLMFSQGNAFFGTKWFFLQGMPEAYGNLAIPILTFFFQFAFSEAASTIASGLLAERTDFRADLIYSFFSGRLIYPIFGHWAWGCGWAHSSCGWDGSASTPAGRSLSEYKRGCLKSHSFALETASSFLPGEVEKGSPAYGYTLKRKAGDPVTRWLYPLESV